MVIVDGLVGRSYRARESAFRTRAIRQPPARPPESDALSSHVCAHGGVPQDSLDSDQLVLLRLSRLPKKSRRSDSSRWHRTRAYSAQSSVLHPRDGRCRSRK